MKGKTKDTPDQRSSMFDGKPVSRREFIEKLALGGGAFVLLSGCTRWVLPGSGEKEREKIYEFIAVDYTKCTGCRTCEAVCSAFSNPISIDGQMVNGPGNPFLSNIIVHSFNPDVSAPSVCARCTDTPCVSACPVDPDPATGLRAIYQDKKWGAITSDPERCISCGSCMEACSKNSVGILAQHPETGSPMRMCTFCDGDPQCVKACPYEALSIIRVDADYANYRMAPEAIAKKLNKVWYDFSI